MVAIATVYVASGITKADCFRAECDARLTTTRPEPQLLLSQITHKFASRATALPPRRETDSRMGRRGASIGYEAASNAELMNG